MTQPYRHTRAFLTASALVALLGACESTPSGPSGGAVNATGGPTPSEAGTGGTSGDGGGSSGDSGGSPPVIHSCSSLAAVGTWEDVSPPQLAANGGNPTVPFVLVD